METINKSLSHYIWENIESLEQYFSNEEHKIYIIFLKFKKNNDKDAFISLLDLIADNQDLIETLENTQNDLIDNIDDMSIGQIAKVLTISPYEVFTDKLVYLDRALYFLEKEDTERNEILALLLNNVAIIYQWKNDFTKALNLYERALKIREEVLGEIHPETAQSYYYLGNYYRRMDKLTEALNFHEKALKIREELLDEKHPETAKSYDNIGIIYYLKSEYTKALNFFEKALKIREEVLGEVHPDTAQSYNNLGSYYYRMDKLTEALNFHEKALKIREELLGQNHPDTTQSYNNLANVYKAMKDYDEAIYLHKKALKIREEVSGENHLDIAQSYEYLANIYLGIGKLEDALFYSEKALKMKEKLLGKIIHSSIANSYGLISNIFYAMKENDEDGENINNALTYQKKALKMREEMRGEKHPDTIQSYNNLANIYISLGENKKALELYEKALKINQELFGENNKTTILVHNNINITMQNENKAFFINKNNSNLDFRIDEITIKNFKQFKSFSMDFSKNINIIVGENAIGKTTLLQAISLVLLKKNSLDARKVEYAKYITKGEKESEITITHNGHPKKIKILPDERIIENDYFIPFLLSYGSNFFTNETNDVKEVVRSIINQTIHQDFTSSIFKDYTSSFSNPIRILEFLDLEKSKNKKDIQDIFINNINNFLDTFTLVRENKNYFFRKNDSDDSLELEDLSEGYRGNILLITDMLVKILGTGWKPDTIEGIVMIDEFDKHLHPRWQSKLISKLSETFPKIQFILTTHNPMSILDREADEITILEESDEGLRAIRKKVGTKKIGISTILLEYFGVYSTVSETMQEKINSFTKLKLKEDVLTLDEKTQLKELEEYLDETVATNFIYNKAYFKFLKFLKNNKNIDFNEYENMTDEEMNKLLEEFKGLFT